MLLILLGGFLLAGEAARGCSGDGMHHRQFQIIGIHCRGVAVLRFLHLMRIWAQSASEDEMLATLRVLTVHGQADVEEVSRIILQHEAIAQNDLLIRLVPIVGVQCIFLHHAAVLPLNRWACAVVYYGPYVHHRKLIAEHQRAYTQHVCSCNCGAYKKSCSLCLGWVESLKLDNIHV